jgi:hypothetical protein
MEDNDRALYTYYQDIANTYVNSNKLPSDTEAEIIDVYLKNYIGVRLTNLFLIGACKPFTDFIDFFESRKVRCHLRFEKMVFLLLQHLSFFLKDDGSRDRLSVKKLLEVDYTCVEKQLSKQDIVIGVKVKKFIKEIGMTVESPELREFFESVFRFYQASAAHMIKYFKVPLTSKTLEYLSVLSPKAKAEPLEQQRIKWGFLGGKFNNFISEEDLTRLLTVELPKYKLLEDPDDEEEVDAWLSRVADVKEEGEQVFRVLSKLGLACATIYNSSSETERDFSKHSLILGDPHKHSMSPRMLQAKLTLQSAISEEGKFCKRCKANDEEREEKKKNGEVKRRQVNHCHCSFFDPEPEMLSDFRNSGPWKRNEEDQKKKHVELNNNKKEAEVKKKNDEEEAKRDLQQEARKMKKMFQEAAVKAAKEKTAKAKIVLPVKKKR